VPIAPLSEAILDAVFRVLSCFVVEVLCWIHPWEASFSDIDDRAGLLDADLQLLAWGVDVDRSRSCERRADSHAVVSGTACSTVPDFFELLNLWKDIFLLLRSFEAGLPGLCKSLSIQDGLWISS
jgi:hypothetical protein